MKRKSLVSVLLTIILSTSVGSPGCGGTTDAPIEDPYETLAKQGATLECVPTCLKMLAMECVGSGMCTTSVAGGSNGANGTSHQCYDNKLKVTSTVMTDDGKQVTRVAASVGSALCRQVNLTQGPDGAFYSVTDKIGTIIKAKITAYPRLTVTCGDQTTELDRTTACGKLAELILGGPKTPPVQNCVVGTCSP